MTQEARARAIENFSDLSSSSPRVFLLSLTAGGVGLNLTAATRVFLMDPVGYVKLYFAKQRFRLTYNLL